MPEARAVEALAPARVYRGRITEPERWAGFAPRRGDVILATPAKSGTTWAQSMIAMLLHGSTRLPDVLGRVSPWIDANFSTEEEIAGLLARQSGRRVIKTHTPIDGWPVWEGVRLVAVFRHPLEVFLSIRKHLANSKLVETHPLLEEFDAALGFYLDAPFSAEDVDHDTLAVLVRHFEAAVSGRWPDMLLLNYAAMSRDHAGTLARLDAYLATNATPELLDEIRRATGFGAMKARAADFAPEASKDIWRDTQGFFAGGRSGGWRESFTDAQVARYEARFAEVLPDATHRRWIETGLGNV
jgi:hypothetical protein